MELHTTLCSGLRPPPVTGKARFSARLRSSKRLLPATMLAAALLGLVSAAACSKDSASQPTTGSVAAICTSWPRWTTLGDAPARVAARIMGATSRSSGTAVL